MKKRCSIFFFLIITIQYLNAQKHDKNWVLGLDNIGTPIKPYYKGFIMSFEDTGIVFNENKNNMRQSRTNISMSDEFGKLQFFTNGKFINSYNNTLMENGDSVIYPNIFAEVDMYTAHQAYFCLPDNTKKGIYYLYQTYIDRIDVPNFEDSSECSTKLLICKIDMNANNGLGKVIYKHRIIFNDQNYYRNEFVRHGNGKLWWSLMNHVNGLEYSILLWDNDIITSKEKIKIPKTFNDSLFLENGNVQKFISLDGS